jgi:hypothetical protein
MKLKGLCVLVSLLALSTATVLSLPNNQQRQPLDYEAVFKTHLARINVPVMAGQSPRPRSLGTTVTPTTTSPQAQEAIALYPANSNNSVAVTSDFSLRGGASTTKYAVSFNNGAAGTWFEHFIPILNGRPATSDGQLWEFNSDPVVAIDQQANVFIASLYFNEGFTSKANGVYVSIGRLVGTNLGLKVETTIPVATNLDVNSNTVEDKEWIAVDNSTNSATSGNVYVSWTHFVGPRNSICFSRSNNQGRTWSGSIKINPDWQDGGVQGAQVAVGPSGEVYVVYEVFLTGNKRQHYLAKSADGGKTFSAAIPISPVFDELTFSSAYRKNSFPSIAVSPANGHVYVVYADQPSADAGAEVEFIASRDGGATFAAPVSVNSPALGHQFMPAVAVDTSGVVHISWFDTRNDLTKTSSYDIYASNSFNDGTIFCTNNRVTQISIDAGNSTFIGDYAGIAANGGYAHPVWTSGGFNNGLLQTATLQ